MIQEPSGVICSSCHEEIDLFDGPVRMLGRPQWHPFCWRCFRDLYRSGLMPQCDIACREEDDKLWIWMGKDAGC